ARHHCKRGRLAGPARAKEGHELALAQRQADAVHGVLSAVISLAQRIDVQVVIGVAIAAGNRGIQHEFSRRSPSTGEGWDARGAVAAWRARRTRRGIVSARIMTTRIRVETTEITGSACMRR